MARYLAPLCLLLGLAGCAVYPAAPGYYSPPGVGVRIAPRPHYAPYRWGRRWGYRRW